MTNILATQGPDGRSVYSIQDSGSIAWEPGEHGITAATVNAHIAGNQAHRRALWDVNAKKCAATATG